MLIVVALCILATMAYAAWEISLVVRKRRQRERHFSDVARRMYRQ